MPAKKQQLVAIDDYLIDCSLSEQHSFESDVTEYPVESGGNITDNIRPLPITVEMECIVSNTPLGQLVGVRNMVQSDDGLFSPWPAEEAYQLLLTIREQRKPVTIRTSLQTFENMALKSLSIPRASGRGDELRFTASFVQITAVENKRSIRVSVPIGNKNKNASKTPTPSKERQYLIDMVHHTWWDPDIGRWRKGVVFARWQQKEGYFLSPRTPTGDYLVKTDVEKFRFTLSRKKIMPVSWRASGAWVPPLLIVDAHNVVLDGFTIQKEFTGLTSNFSSIKTTPNPANPLFGEDEDPAFGTNEDAEWQRAKLKGKPKPSGTSFGLRGRGGATRS